MKERTATSSARTVIKPWKGLSSALDHVTFMVKNYYKWLFVYYSRKMDADSEFLAQSQIKTRRQVNYHQDMNLQLMLSAWIVSQKSRSVREGSLVA